MRAPPYAKAIKAKLAEPETWGSYCGTSPDGRHLTFFVAAGSDAWGWVHSRLDRFFTTLLPPGEDPDLFDWSVLKDHPPVLIVATSELDPAIVDSLATALVRDGAERVLVLDRRLTRYTIGEHVQ